MDLKELIESAEKKHKQILEDFFKNSWGTTYLFSHDIDHHRRVWLYVKELLNSPELPEDFREIHLPEKLIIASYLHDVGMSVDPGVRHGRYGSKICRQFLEKHQMDEGYYGDVISAIENHDDKEYKSPVSGNSVLTILSAADDLDAFGYIGIFRYLEIYIKRGSSLKVIGEKIRKNAGKRYENFIALFGADKKLAEKHRKRFEVLKNFFKAYTQAPGGQELIRPDIDSYFIIADFISVMIRDRISPDRFLSCDKRYSEDPVISGFINKLHHELTQN